MEVRDATSAVYRVESEAARADNDVPSGYKRTEVGVIPEDWQCVRVGAQCDLITKGTTPTSIGRQFTADGIRFLKAEAISEVGRIIPEMTAFIDAPTHQLLQRSQLEAGDLLISIAGVLGRIGQVKERDLPANTNQALAIVRLSKRSAFEHDFLFWFLCGEAFQKQIRDTSVQGAQANISLQNVQDFQVVRPHQSEQQAIAEALSDADALIESLQQLIGKRRALKQGTMQALLTGRQRLPGFSGEWQTKRLGDMVELISSGIYGTENPAVGLVGFPVATTAHIEMNDTWNDKNMDLRYFSPAQLTHYLPKEDDLIIVKSSGSAASIQSGKMGFINKPHAGKFIFSNFLMLLRPVSVHAKYLYFYLSSVYVKSLLPSLVEASTYPNIRIPEYLAIEMPLPSRVEQTAIAAVLSDMDAEIDALEARLAKTRALKAGMMQQLLTGRIRLV